MDQSTRTIYSAALQDALILQVPWSRVAYTTLNEKYNIVPDLVPATGQYPAARYFAIGNGGHKMSVGAGGMSKPEPIQHRPTDAALYNQLPFVLRETSNDLTPAQQANYGLRREETWNNVRYAAYYLKRIDFTNVAVQMLYKTVASDGTVTTTPFVPDSSNLNPTPPTLSSTGTNVATGDYVTASALLDLLLGPDDVTELLNVANVIYQDPGYAIISELAMVSGCDKVVQYSNPSGNFNFNEVIVAQCMMFISAFYALEFANNGVDLKVDCGSTEPMVFTS